MKNLQWFKTVTRVESVLMGYYGTQGEHEYLKKKIGAGLEYKILFPDPGGHVLFYEKNNWGKFAKTIITKSNKNINWLKNLADEIDKFCTHNNNYCNELRKKILENKTNSKLLKLIKQVEKIRFEFSFALFPPLVIENYLEERIKSVLLKELIIKGKESEFDNYWNIITTKIKLNENEKEELELLKIANSLKKQDVSKRKIEFLLDRHVKKYCWLSYYGLSLTLWSKKDFLARLNEYKTPEKTIKRLTNLRKDNSEKLKKIKKEFRKNKELLNLIELSQKFLFLRTHRTEALRQFYFGITPLLKTVARRFKVKNWLEITYLTPNELIKSLKVNRLMLKDIKKRQKQWMMIKTPNKINIEVSNKRISGYKKILFQKKNIKVIKGMIASQGEAKGFVKIIKSIQDINKVKNKEVLVTTMTTPDMVIAMNKASAIVTDEGGMTCHAAIVSREIGIPCVVGTKIATRSLKDGDLIKVDAVSGKVEILDRARDKLQ